LAPATRWNSWPEGAPYLPADYTADGFVHCSPDDVVMLAVANNFYRDEPGDFVMLLIDPARLSAPLKWERPDDDLAPEFPHIYGPIDRAAVVDVRAVRRGADGEFFGW
jgi:uncharacterized protein (DUF952 family)